MRITASDLSAPQAYKLLTGIVVPRPIAWITTVSETGSTNLAPFSCFTFVSSNPPMLGVNIGPRESGPKDTAVNIMRNGVYVVNIADDSMIAEVHGSSFDYPLGESEVAVLALATVPSEMIDCPRLKEVPVSMECRLSTVANFGRGHTQFIVGEVLCFHIRDDLYENGKINAARLRPICRIAGPNYAYLGTIVTQRSPGNWGPPARIEDLSGDRAIRELIGVKKYALVYEHVDPVVDDTLDRAVDQQQVAVPDGRLHRIADGDQHFGPARVDVDPAQPRRAVRVRSDPKPDGGLAAAGCTILDIALGVAWRCGRIGLPPRSNAC